MTVRRVAAYVGLLAVAVVGVGLVERLGRDLVAPAPPPGVRRFDVAHNTGHADWFLRVLLVMAVIIVLARAIGLVFRWLRQPAVMAEVIAGILLGPSLLGTAWPEATAFLLPAPAVPMLHGIAQLGVLLYLFVVGIELDPSVLRERAGSVVAISHFSIVIPFVLGSVLSLYLYSHFGTSDVPFFVFALFGGISMSITAFPVLARILDERDLRRTRLGTLALACAAIDDITAWCLLALVVAIAHASVGDAVLTVTLAVVYVLFMLILARPWLHARVRRMEESGKTASMLAMVFVALLASSIATSAIGIHALFGAFLLGVIIPHDSRLAKEIISRLEDFVVIVLLPAFFAFSGMRTQIGLVTGMEWLVVGVIVAVACAGKLGGAFLGARMSGVGTRDAALIGALMNTRGLMELVVLNIALDLGVFSPTMFTMMVLMALVTTLMTTPLVDAISSSGGQR